MKSVVSGTGVTILATVLVACSDPATAPPGTAPRPVATNTTPSGQVTDIDPCALIPPDQAKELRLNAPHRSEAAGEYTACSWSTLFGSAVSVSLEEQAHTVDQYVASERMGEPPARNLTTSPWTGDRHHGTALDWNDGHTIGLAIVVSPGRLSIVEVYSSDPGKELGRPVTEVLRDAAAVVDHNLPV